MVGRRSPTPATASPPRGTPLLLPPFPSLTLAVASTRAAQPDVARPQQLMPGSSASSTSAPRSAPLDINEDIVSAELALSSVAARARRDYADDQTPHAAARYWPASLGRRPSAVSRRVTDRVVPTVARRQGRPSGHASHGGASTRR